MIYPHCTLRVNNKTYSDCTVYTVDISESVGTREINLIADPAAINTLEGHIESLVDKSIYPQKGSELYIGPNCPYASSDIRRNYKVRRAPDSGDYNVISNLNCRAKWGYYVSCMVSLPDYVFLFKHLQSKADCLAYIKSILPDINLQNCEYYSNLPTLRFLSVNPIYTKLLSGSLTKPCVPYNNLDLSTGNDLDIDFLQLIYMAGKENRLRKESEQNFIIQLNALNQHNWRNYPGTMSLLMNEILRGQYCIRQEMKHHLSKYSKPVQEILSCSVEDYKDERDFYLSRDFVGKLLNIDGTRYVSFNDCVKKICDYNISMPTFTKLFDCITRITPHNFSSSLNEKE